MKAITYFGGEIPVELGDRITMKSFFRSQSAKVIYVPGISEPSSNFGDEYVDEIGILTENNTVYGVFVDPDKREVKKTIVFVSRGESIDFDLNSELDDPVEKNR